MTLAKNKMRLQVITPWGTKVDETVEMVIFRSVTGEMGILPRHEAYLCALDDAPLRILNDGSERRMAVLGGICKVGDSVVTVLTDEAHWPEEIDKERMESLEEQIKEKLQEETDEQEKKTHRAQLRRVQAKLDVSGFSPRSDL